MNPCCLCGVKKRDSRKMCQFLPAQNILWCDRRCDQERARKFLKRRCRRASPSRTGKRDAKKAKDQEGNWLLLIILVKCFVLFNKIGDDSRRNATGFDRAAKTRKSLKY